MKKMIVLLIIIPFILMGCWDAVETENLGVVRLIGLGIGKNNDIRVIIQESPHDKQTSGSQGPGGGSKATFHLYDESGPTVTEAIQRMSANEHHRLHFAHINVIILDEALVSSKGITPVIDFCERNPQLRTSTWMLIAPMGQFDKIISTDVGIGIDSGTILEETINNKKNKSFLTICNIKDFVELVNKFGAEAYTSGVSIGSKNSSNEAFEGNKANTQKFNIRDTAVFKGDKMVGWLTNEEYKGLAWVIGNVKGGIVSIPFEDSELSLRIAKMKSNIQPIIIDGKMQVNINIEILSDIIESQIKYSFMDEDTIKKVEHIQNEKVKKQIAAALEKSRSLGSDVLGFGSYFNMKYPNYLKDVQNNWYSYYSDVKVNINVNSVVKNIGNNYKNLNK